MNLIQSLAEDGVGAPSCKTKQRWEQNAEGAQRKEKLIRMGVWQQRICGSDICTRL